MKYPEYAMVRNEKYKINTDFRVAIKCNEVAEDKTISDTERALAIVYLLFGDKGIDNENLSDEEYNNKINKLLEISKKYFSAGEEMKDNDEQPDMDYVEDEKYIKSSFKYDYNYNPYEMEYLHWYEFYNDLNNLSNSEMGDCCVLNRVRNLRNFDLKEIKDTKEREKIRKAKEQVALKKYKKQKVQATDEQTQNALKLYEALGYEIRKE